MCVRVCVFVSVWLCGYVRVWLCVYIYRHSCVICVGTTGQRRLRFSMCVRVCVFLCLCFCVAMCLCGCVCVYTDIVVSFVSAPPDEDASDSERQAVANEIRQRCLDMLMLAGSHSQKSVHS